MRDESEIPRLCRMALIRLKAGDHSEVSLLQLLECDVDLVVQKKSI